MVMSIVLVKEEDLKMNRICSCLGYVAKNGCHTIAQKQMPNCMR